MSWLTEPDEDWDERQSPPRSRLKLALAVLAGWLAVSLIVLVGLLTFGGHRSTNQPVGAPTTGPSTPAPASSTAAASSTAPTGPSGSPTGQAAGDWVLRASDDQTDCTAHSYGQVQVFFARTPCSSVRRSLFSTAAGGRDVVVAASTVTFGSPGQAADYHRLVASDGTGNVNDLLREGTRYPGSPSKLPVAAFASRVEGVRVLVAEAAFVQGRSDHQDAGLLAAAQRAVAAG
ncbi:MAG: hypothetical protein ABIQ09_18960 [Jatrophihabitantaceae bacterium]